MWGNTSGNGDTCVEREPPLQWERWRGHYQRRQKKDGGLLPSNYEDRTNKSDRRVF